MEKKMIRPIELEYYRQSRLQLVDHIIDNMVKEYNKFGGYDAVIDWYAAAIQKNKDSLIMKCVEWYKGLLDGTNHNHDLCAFAIPAGDCLSTSLIKSDDPYILRQNKRFILNTDRVGDYGIRYKCPITGKTANMWFVFEPNTYQNIESLIGEEVPKILKGFRYSGPEYSGNDSLHSCDPVGFILSPFANGSKCKYKNKFEGMAEEPFMVSVGLSKLGLNKLLKSLDKN